MRSFNYFWLLLLLVSPSAFSAIYYYDSIANASAACNAAKSSGSYPGSQCQIYSPASVYNLIGSFGQLINRYYYTGCPEGTTAIGSGGSCIAPPTCEQTWTGGEIVWSAAQGQCVKYPNLQDAEACAYGAGQGWSKSVVVNSNDSSGPGQYVDPASKCVADIDATTSDCASRVNSDGDGTYRCKVTGKYNGDYNPNGTNSPDGFCPTGNCTEAPETPEVPSPTPSDFNDTQPCVYGSDGQGGLTCTSSTKNEKEGSSQCGTVNGAHTCINKAPQYNGIEIVSNVKSQTNADGSTTTTKTDTATSTTCKNIGDCTTSSATTTTTTTKNGASETTSISGSCVGALCPDKNTNPDGDGDGFGDCVGDDCSDGGGAGMNTPELEEGATYGDSLGTYFSAIQSAPIVAAVTSISLPSGGNCPVYTESIEYIGTVSTSTACGLATSLLTPLHYLFLAIWAFVAVRTTMTA